MSSENLAGFLGKATKLGREVISRCVAPEPFKVYVSTGAAEAWQGTDDDELVEALVVAGPNNTDTIRFSLYEAVGAANYLPLNAKDSVRLGGIRYDDIHLKFMAAGDSIHILRVIADGPMSGADTV